MGFLPEDFVVPTLVAGPRFRIRPITVHDVVRDYDAVMTSREQLWDMFGESWGWPRADLSLEQDLIDLAWHQREGQLRKSFTYAVLSTDETRLLGCIYIEPSRKTGADAEVAFWVRTDESGLEKELDEFVREWLSSTWPFERVRYPARDISWAEWKALPDS